MAKIKSSLRPCQTCEAGKLHGEIHVDAAAMDYAPMVERDSRCQETVTQLPPDAEDAVRRTFADVFQTDPLDLLLFQHIYNGGTYANYRKALRDLVVRVIDRDYDLSPSSRSFRSVCQLWAQRLADRFPPFAAMTRRGRK